MDNKELHNQPGFLGVDEMRIGNNLQYEGMIYVTKPYFPSWMDLIWMLSKAKRSGILTNNGPIVQLLEKEIKRTIDVECVATSSGTQALEAVLEYVRIKTGKSDVITTGYSFVATASAIIRAGMRPQFVDIDPVTGLMDLDKAKKEITEHTACLLPVSVYGQNVDYIKLKNILRETGVSSIIDAAQAYGVWDRSDSSEIAKEFCHIISLHATKTMHAIEGGLVICRDQELIRSCREYINFGYIEDGNCRSIGTNAKMSEIHALFGLLCFKDFKRELDRRRIVYEEYLKRLNQSQICKNRIAIQPVGNNYGYFPIRIIEKGDESIRDIVIDALYADGIIARRYFWPLIQDLKSFRSIGHQWNEAGENINARTLAKGVICLPIYAAMKKWQVRKICNSLDSILAKYQ